jgi:DNA-binding NarL/FixJ family response regulator
MSMYSILIIEDDPSYRSMMESFLQLEGFEVRTASDGQSGLSLVREKRPDLVLCDIMMPGMDGHSVMETMKSEDGIADIPFIFVTALGDRADVRRGMSAGADDYLTKPFSADELLAAITGRIRHHEVVFKQRNKSAFQKEQAILCTKISKREREVLLMVGQGDTTRGIAERLGVTQKTIDVHRASLMNKLGAANAAGLARWAFILEQIGHASE